MSPKPCWDYSMSLVSWIIYFVPIIAAVWAWVWVYKDWGAKSRKFASAIALTMATGAAMVGACGTIYLTYFTCVPSSTPWTALPEYTLDAYVMLLALSGGIAGLVALVRGNSRRLCGLVLSISGWQLLFTFFHASTV